MRSAEKGARMNKLPLEGVTNSTHILFKPIQTEIENTTSIWVAKLREFHFYSSGFFFVVVVLVVSWANNSAINVLIVELNSH